MNVLIALDYHALTTAFGCNATDQMTLLRWIIDVVDSDAIQIWYREEKSYQCELRTLPNWAYSYALALFQLHRLLDLTAYEDTSESEDAKLKADRAIQMALNRFPNVVGQLLSRLEVDTTGRSFRRDWVSVLDVAASRSRQLSRHWHADCDNAVVLSATLQTCELVTKIFVHQSAKLWSEEEVLQWLYDNLTTLQSKSGADERPPPPNPAVMRYAGVDPADYDNKVQMLPEDANIVNPVFLEHAMIMHPNLPRFVRRQARRQGQGDELADHDRNDLDANGNRLDRGRFLGPPTQIVNPDWPMLEVFWRSILPWNRVEGIPPPRR